MSETVVRMGELAASATRGDVLSSIGLGSCIGVALLSRNRPVAGLAHVMLPEVPAGGGPVGKFADTAIPALTAALTQLDAPAGALVAVLVGGASMFSFGGAGGQLDIGGRNEAAARRGLAKLGIPVVAAETGGNKGRTIRVTVGGGVHVRAAGDAEFELYSLSAEGIAA